MTKQAPMIYFKWAFNYLKLLWYISNEHSINSFHFFKFAIAFTDDKTSSYDIFQMSIQLIHFISLNLQLLSQMTRQVPIIYFKWAFNEFISFFQMCNCFHRWQDKLPWYISNEYSITSNSFHYLKFEIAFTDDKTSSHDTFQMSIQLIHFIFLNLQLLSQIIRQAPMIHFKWAFNSFISFFLICNCFHRWQDKLLWYISNEHSIN